MPNVYLPTKVAYLDADYLGLIYCMTRVQVVERRIELLMSEPREREE
jgi:hypothetical protein